MFCKWDCQLDLPSIMFMALPLSSKIYVPYTLARSSSSKRWCDNIIMYLHARGGQCGAAWIGLPERSTPFSLLLSSPLLPSLPRSLARLSSVITAVLQRDMPATLIIAPGEERERGERERSERGREGGIEKEREREREREREHIETEYHAAGQSRLMLKDLTFIPQLMGRQVSRLLES